MSRRLRAGLIGAGWVADSRHMPALAACSEVELVGVCDHRVERARQLASKWPRREPRTFSDVAALLAEQLDIVLIATPPWSHHEVAIAALEAGSHVFIEKPMAMNGREAADMARHAEIAGRMLCVCHNLRFSRSASRARQLLAAASPRYLFATQLSADTRRLPTWYRDLPGGLLFDEIPHLLYMATDLLGGELSVEGVRARGKQNELQSVEVLVDGPFGAGQLTIVLGAPLSEWHVSVVHRSGVVDLDLFRDVVVSLPPDGRHGSLEIARTSLTATAGHLMGSLRTASALARGRQHWGHGTLISSFVAAAESGGPSPVAIEDALSVVKASEIIVSAVVGSESR